MRHIALDWDPEWSSAWERDEPYSAGDRVWFHRERGALVWVCGPDSGTDEEHDAAMAEVLADPSYEEIPALHHAEHHEIFRRWRATLPEEITRCCNPKSIGGFRRDLRWHFPDRAEAVWSSWYEFRDAALRDLATAWLAERGFQVTWRDVDNEGG